jgi:hypothetical protein
MSAVLMLLRGFCHHLDESGWWIKRRKYYRVHVFCFIFGSLDVVVTRTSLVRLAQDTFNNARF